MVQNYYTTVFYLSRMISLTLSVFRKKHTSPGK